MLHGGLCNQELSPEGASRFMVSRRVSMDPIQIQGGKEAMMIKKPFPNQMKPRLAQALKASLAGAAYE
jgi:hypothetical protein